MKNLFNKIAILFHQVKMLRSVVENLRIINDVVEVMGHHDRGRKITAIEAEKTKELVLMLKPFEKATKTLEGGIW